MFLHVCAARIETGMKIIQHQDVAIIRPNMLTIDKRIEHCRCRRDTCACSLYGFYLCNNDNKNASNTWLCSCRLAQRYRSGVISWFRVGFASHASRQHRKNAKMHRRVRTFPGLNLHWSRQSPLELLQQQPASLWPTKSVGYLGTVLYGTCTCRSRLYDRNIRVDLLVVGVPSTRSLVRYISTRLFVL